MGNIASKQQCSPWVSYHFSVSMESYVLQKAMTEKCNAHIIACVIASQWSSTSGVNKLEEGMVLAGKL